MKMEKEVVDVRLLKMNDKIKSLKSLKAKDINEFLGFDLKWYQIIYLDIMFWFQDKFRMCSKK